MNFASKKLNGFYTSAQRIPSREEQLLAENQSLKKKNKRLSTAMIYLVDQIEVRLPLWSPKPPVVAKKKIRPPEPKIIGEAKKPKKHLSIPEQNMINGRSAPLSLQQIFADKKRPTASKAPPLMQSALAQEAEIPKASPLVIEAAQPEEDVKNELNLAPEEIFLLAAPTKEKAKDPQVLNSSENLVERVAKKISAQEASLAYLAVSVAASPVPDTKELDNGDVIESKASMQNKIMREAMLRRVNRLRW